ncbi:MAG: N-acetylmuramoyl-L-alanine amidase, partial [Nitrospirales bacterium]
TLKRHFPKAVQIAREWNKPVTITINVAALEKYKVLSLKNPSRLVLDMFPSSTTRPKEKLAPPKFVKKSPAKPKNAPRKAVKKTKPKVAAPKIARKTKSKIASPVKLLKPSPAAGKLLIVIDPGHGGKDPGALGRKGTREKDIVLKVSKLLKSMIKERLSATVLMTREKDVFIELEDRAEFANSKKADLFVSIHVNSHPKKSVKGLELYHFGEASDPRALEVAARENGTPLKDNGPAWQFILADKLTDKKIENSRDLAWIARKALVGQLRKHYKIKDHGVKTAPFFVLRMTTMPGILAEIAFVSNPTEEKLLTSKTYQKRTAEGIFKGIKAYISPLQTVSR